MPREIAYNAVFSNFNLTDVIDYNGKKFANFSIPVFASVGHNGNQISGRMTIEYDNGVLSLTLVNLYSNETAFHTLRNTQRSYYDKLTEAFDGLMNNMLLF